MVEFLTGDAPLALLLDPVPLVALSISYGGGALLARELVKRWGRGTPSIVLLGMAYGIINEGVNSGGFFDPHFFAVTAAGVEDFARWGGVNVFWAFNMTVVHAVFSVTIPIVIVDALFRAPDRLLGNRALLFMFLIFAADTVFLTIVAGKIFAPRPVPDPFAYAVVMVVLVSFILAARLFPRTVRWPPIVKPPVIVLFLASAIAAAVFFLTFLKLHEYVRSAPLNLAVSMLLVLLYAVRLLRFPTLSARDRIALAAGAEGMFIFSSIQSGRLVQAGVAIALMVVTFVSTTPGWPALGRVRS